MMILALTGILAENGWWSKIVDYQLIKGNEIWRFLAVLLVIIIAIAAGRITQFFINGYALRRDKKRGVTALAMLLRCLTRPISVAIFAIALFICKALLV